MAGYLNKSYRGNDSMANLTDNYEYGDEYGDELVFQCSGIQASVATATCFAIIFFLSLSGNVLVLCVLAFYENLRHVTNLFILNLAVSDLVFATTLPFWTTYHLSHWVFGNALCKILSGAYFVGLYSGLMFLTAMTVDRYVAVVHSTSGVLRKRRVCARVICVAVWLFSISASMLDVVFSEATPDDAGLYQCEAVYGGPTEHQVAYYLQLILLFLLPLFVIIFCYSRILNIAMLRVVQRKQKTVMVILCIVVAFFVCWVPYNLTVLLKTVNSSTDCSINTRMDMAFIVCRILAYSHCCLNPLLYSFTQKFRRHLSSLLCRDIPLQRRRRSGRSSGVHSVSNIIQRGAVSHDDASVLAGKNGACVEMKALA